MWEYHTTYCCIAAAWGNSSQGNVSEMIQTSNHLHTLLPTYLYRRLLLYFTSLSFKLCVTGSIIFCLGRGLILGYKIMIYDIAGHVIAFKIDTTLDGVLVFCTWSEKNLSCELLSSINQMRIWKRKRRDCLINDLFNGYG